MNIKSLLIGSAAALVAVSGARAADAVVAEPEAVEYVRVCDAYGAGYFYIPGTETCLRIHGYVRYDIGAGELLGFDTDPDGAGPLVPNGLGDAFAKNARASVRFSTASETDYGTLRTYVETRFNYGSGAFLSFKDANGNGVVDPGEATVARKSDNKGVSLNFAYIELGGLRVGKDESVFTTFTGYAGNVINDTLVGYGPFDTTLISYTFTSGAFSGIISLEDDGGAGKGYIPDVVAGAKYSSGDWSVSGVVGYDEAAKAVAGKVRVDGKVGSVSGFLMAGYGDKKGGKFHAWGGSWAVWGGLSAAVSEKATANIQLSYDKSKTFGAALNVDYTVVPGFTITPEVAYKKTAGVKGQFGGQLRFQRSF